jgi:hypothetical protein
METIKYTINKGDVISSLRNWMLVNTVMLLAYFNQLRDMFVSWKFDFVAIREMIVIAVFSLIAFFIKRYFIGKS